MIYYLKSVEFFMFQKVENMLLAAKSLFGRCHGNGMAIKVSFWLCDFYVIRNQLRQLFWHSEKVTYHLFYRACMILRENAS